jgi:hypothetical protein
VTTEFDPKKSYLTIKSHEKMIAYVSFLIRLEDNDAEKEGVIKISKFQRPYGGGQLTLTFIINTDGDDTLKASLNKIFSNLTDESMRRNLGRSFEKVNKVSLDSLAHIKDWYVEEINFHFNSLEERENVLVEGKLIPALQRVLPFSFDPVEWWPENLAPQSLISKEIEKQKSVKSIFKRWFSLG